MGLYCHFLALARDFLFLKHICWLWAYPAPCSMGSGGFSSGLTVVGLWSKLLTFLKC